VFDVAVTCLVVTALLAYLNQRFVGLPTTIGVMAIAILLSLVLLGLDRLGFELLHEYQSNLVGKIDFSRVLTQGMLSMLLFAGALHVDLSDLRSYRWQVGILAVFGTLASTLIVGFALWLFLPWVGQPLPLQYCLVFGALISPTDPIAVMGILRSAGAPESLRLVITGEALFNDGVGVVLFALLAGAVVLGDRPDMGQGVLLLAREGGGGIVFGLVLGYATFYLLKSIDNYEVEVLLTLAAVLGGYALAGRLQVSGLLSIVVMGLVIGTTAASSPCPDVTRANMDLFWRLLDAILNSVLFVLIGMEALVIQFTPGVLVAALGAIAITLLARWLSVGAPVLAFKRTFALPEGSWQVLTWGGLRGGISVALVLSMPGSPQRDLALALTYAVVTFSILVQGLSIGWVARRSTECTAAEPSTQG
jgi:CPA1 family monovalent cation:H+ antiporter